MKYLWVLQKSDLEKVKQLSQKYNFSPIIATVLSNRKITTKEAITKLFDPTLKDLYNPFLMADMEVAVSRLEKALLNKEKVLIFGDYDVDGTTGTSLLYLFLCEIGLVPIYYIPDREKEGYGISTQGINFALKSGASLIISCDCGINAFNEVDYANENSIDVIITDHHEPAEKLPNAIAILDPKRADDNYPFNELCGCGVAFKLLHGLSIRNQIPLEKLFRHLDIVAIGTAADIVPILDENRIIVAKGLEVLNHSEKIGVKSLVKIAGFENRQINVVNIVFGLAPRINAAGRIGEATKAVQLLTTFDYGKAAELSQLLDSENRDRQIIEREITDSAILQLNAKYDLEKDRILILHNHNWHSGVIGIVASKLKELYNRPVIMISFQNDIGKGSARSIPGFDLYAAFNACSDLLAEFGGHKMAAGLTISKESLPAFEERLKSIASECISPDMLQPSIKAECEILLEDINREILEFLRKMAPFGPGNMRPVFITRSLKISGLPRIVGENHLKFKVSQGKMVLSSIGWKLGNLYEMLISGKPLDMAFVIEENEWNGIKEIQLNIKDMKYSDENFN